MISRTFWKDIS